MRFLFAFLALTFIVAHPALAGTLNLQQGQASWQSTRCKEPVEPPSLMAVSPESQANNINELITEYNQYAAKQQDYMNCLSDEAQTDSTTTSMAITNSAQAIIHAVQDKVTVLGNSLHTDQQ